jgi:hypothetical protein
LAPIQIGSVEDHVHVLARSGRTLAQAGRLKELKRVSVAWLQERGLDFADLEWRGSYANFSISQSNLEQVKEYSATREEYHRKTNFQDGFRALSRKHEMGWGGKIVWD